MTADVPRAATALLAKLEAWSVFERAARGPCEFGGLSEETNGEGKRHRVTVVEDVDSYLVRARHVDGRAFVAVWVRRSGKGWTLDTAWRGRRRDEHAPKQVTATQLRAYVVAPSALEEAA